MPGELFVCRRDDRRWAFLREDDRTVEIRTERSGERVRAGGILKTRVVKLMPGIQSAFVELGGGREGFLHAKDLRLPDENETAAESPIEDRLRVGRELLVQIYREPLGDKAPRVTCVLSLPSRDLVLFPLTVACGVSRRIVDPAERERLAGILAALPAGDGGFVARTAASGVDVTSLEEQAGSLRARWREMSAAAMSGPVPRWIHDESDLLMRCLRDTGSGTLTRVVVEDLDDLERAREYIASWPTSSTTVVELHSGSRSLLEEQQLDTELRKALRRKIWLRSGGYLVIEPTEALVSIDVNTGKYIGGRQLEETAVRINLEAADRIARELRLRDLGGIIAIDFIDMERKENRDAVLDRLGQCLRRDPSRTNLSGVSALGVVELTRRRSGPGLLARVTHPCPHCSGQGRVADEDLGDLLTGGQTG